MKMGIFGWVAFFLALLSPLASAGAEDYDIAAVYVDGIHAEGNLVQVELGSIMQIQVYVEGTGESTDVRVGVWIGGYEYSALEESTELFEVENGVSYKQTLHLEIPDDLDISENEYTLHVLVYDANDREEQEYSLYFEQERHDIIIEDVLFSAHTLAPGDYLGVKVRLENQGKKDEENMKVTVSIPELGVSQRVYVDELVSGNQDDAPTAYLVLPRDAAGNYIVFITVEYNNGYSEVIDKAYISVEGELVYDENTFVSISSINDLVAGEEHQYKVQVTNLGESAKKFYLRVDGLDAAYTPHITVPAQSSGEFVFTLYPEEIGTKYVFVEVSTDEGLVTQELLTVDVEDKNYTGALVIFAVFVLILFVLIYFLMRKGITGKA